MEILQVQEGMVEMRNLIILSLLVLSLFFFDVNCIDMKESKTGVVPSEEYSAEKAVLATIHRVVDGDTIDVVLEDGKQERVQLLCVDTEESPHPNEKLSAEFTKATAGHVGMWLSHGMRVELEFEEKRKRNKQNSLLAYVFRDELEVYDAKTNIPGYTTPPDVIRIRRNINLELVYLGCSRYFTEHGDSKKYGETFEKAESFARERKLGIWSPKRTWEVNSLRKEKQ